MLRVHSPEVKYVPTLWPFVFEFLQNSTQPIRQLTYLPIPQNFLITHCMIHSKLNEWRKTGE